MTIMNGRSSESRQAGLDGRVVTDEGEANRPNPNKAFPNPNIPSLCYIKNVVKNPRVIIGDYTYYDDVDWP